MDQPTSLDSPAQILLLELYSFFTEFLPWLFGTFLGHLNKSKSTSVTAESTRLHTHTHTHPYISTVYIACSNIVAPHCGTEQGI